MPAQAAGISTVRKTMQVGQIDYLYLETNEAVENATWISNHPAVSILSQSTVACQVQVNSYTDDTVVVQCEYRYWYLAGTAMYLMSGAMDYYITIEKPIPKNVTVTFSAGDGTLSGVSSKIVTVGDVYGNLPSASKPCAIFEGWHTSSGAMIGAATTVTAQGDHTLYAYYSDNHDYTAYQMSKLPSCTEAGEKQRTCKVCGKVDKQSINALGHRYSPTVITKAPSCEVEGSKESQCRYCDHKLTEAISALDHVWNTGVILTSPTCEAVGEARASCALCGKEDLVELKATGHLYNNSCDTLCNRCNAPREALHNLKTFYFHNEEKHAAICLTCSEEIYTEHCWDDGVAVKPATISGEGLLVYTCTDCSMTKEEVLPIRLLPISPDQWDGSIAEGFAGGSGAEGDPYLIYTAAQLAYLAKSVNEGNSYKGKYILLANDLCLNDETFTFNEDTGLLKVTDGTNTAYLGSGGKGYKSGNNSAFDWSASVAGAWYASEAQTTAGAYSGTLHSWTPIGDVNASVAKPFEGTFDGGGHKISGLYISSVLPNQGLFGLVERDGIVQNLGVENSYVLGKENTAAIVSNLNYGKLLRCYHTGTVCGQGGCLVGYSKTGITVDSYNTGAFIGVRTTSDTILGGGVVGHQNYGRIERCYNAGFVYGRGGVVSSAYSATIDNCYNTGTVYGDSNCCAGIVGSTTESVVSNCYNTGSIDAGSALGTISNPAGKLVDDHVWCGAIIGSDSHTSTIGSSFTISTRMINCYYSAFSARDSNGGTAKAIANRSDYGMKIGTNGHYRVLFGVDTPSYSRENAISISEDGSKLAATYQNFDFETVWQLENPGYTSPSLRCAHSYTVVSATPSSCAQSGTLNYRCATCGDLYDEVVGGEHIYLNDCDRDCGICQQTRSVSEHVLKAAEEVVGATHTTLGENKVVCSNCGVTTRESVDRLTEHSFESYIWIDSSQHIGICACGEQQTFAHTMSDEVLLEATHYGNGVTGHVCEQCGYVATTKTDVIAHSFTEQKTDPCFFVSNPTCTQGETYYLSCVCGAAIEETFSLENALGHSFGIYQSNGPATCAGDETETATCSACGETDTRVKEGTALPHEWNEEWVQEQDAHYKKCKNCDAQNERAEHTMSDGVHCDICGYVNETKTDENDQNDQNGQPTQDGEGDQPDGDSKGEKSALPAILIGGGGTVAAGSGIGLFYFFRKRRFLK